MQDWWGNFHTEMFPWCYEFYAKIYQFAVKKCAVKLLSTTLTDVVKFSGKWSKKWHQTSCSRSVSHKEIPDATQEYNFRSESTLFVIPSASEPQHDKTNKMSVRPAKPQISLGIHSVWSESSLCAQWVAMDPRFLHEDSEDSVRLGGCPGWSESSLGAQPHCWFCRVAAHLLENHIQFFEPHHAKMCLQGFSTR